MAGDLSALVSRLEAVTSCLEGIASRGGGGGGADAGRSATCGSEVAACTAVGW